jgi:hypothetical protein
MVNIIRIIRYVSEIGFSDLDIIWNLGIGIWDFSNRFQKKLHLSESDGADFDVTLLFCRGQLFFGCLRILAIIMPVGLIIFMVSAIAVFSV